MRQSIRALSWTIALTIIIIASFFGTSVYSIFQVLTTQGLGLSGFQTYYSEEGIAFSLILYVNNTGYYDISDMNLTTCINDFRGNGLSNDTTIVDVIKAGANIYLIEHNISLSLGILENLDHLFFEDGNFSIDTYVKMRYAKTFSFQLMIPNISMPWRAPFYNLSVGEPPSLPLPPSSFNGTHYLLAISISFENHAFFDVVGMMRLKIYNDQRKDVGSGIGFVNSTAESVYADQITVNIPQENLSNMTEKGYIDIYFENTNFKFGPVEITYG